MNFRRVICLDLETALIRPGLQAPPVSVCSIFVPEQGAQLFGTWALEAVVAKWLEQDDVVLIGHNIAFDMVVLFEWYPRLRKLIKRAYEANRILDTMMLQRIIEISKGDLRGALALDKLCATFGIQMKHKHEEDEDGVEVKLGFGKHWGTDLSGLTPLEVSYCQDDVIDCHALFVRMWGLGWADQKDLGKLCRTDFCLKTISAFGLRADPAIVSRLEAEARKVISKLTEAAIEQGFMRRDKGNPEPVRTMRNYQQAVAEAFGIRTRCGEGRNKNRLYPDVSESRLQALLAMGLITDTGAISCGKMVLRESGDERLIALADLNEWLAVLKKDLPIFQQGVFHTRFGIANTLRTTSSKPNIQNFRKKAGVRECITALWGAFVASDYVGLENGTLAELVVRYTGRRGMADKISAGWDFHSEVGAGLLGISMDEMLKRLAAGDPIAKRYRNSAKPLNFGLAGNMKNPVTFKSYAYVGYGVKLTLAEAEFAMNHWWATQHDQMAYLQHVERFRDSDEWGSLYSVPIPGTDIVRRGCTSCAAANTGFQALGMQTAADALWFVVMAQLFGEMPGRVCAFIHDELVSDTKPTDIEQTRFHQERLMLKAAEMNLGHVKLRVESVAMDRWSKAAKHSIDERGNLQLCRVQF